MTYLQAVRRITAPCGWSDSPSAQVAVLSSCSAEFAGVSRSRGSENPETSQESSGLVSAGWGYKGATS